jgi:hypothetical protein
MPLPHRALPSRSRPPVESGAGESVNVSGLTGPSQTFSAAWQKWRQIQYCIASTYLLQKPGICFVTKQDEELAQHRSLSKVLCLRLQA